MHTITHKHTSRNVNTHYHAHMLMQTRMSEGLSGWGYNSSTDQSASLTDKQVHMCFHAVHLLHQSVCWAFFIWCILHLFLWLQHQNLSNEPATENYWHTFFISQIGQNLILMSLSSRNIDIPSLPLLHPFSILFLGKMSNHSRGCNLDTKLKKPGLLWCKKMGQQLISTI